MTTFGKSEKTSQLLVEFRYGNPASWSYARYTDWTEDIIFGPQSATFNSEPRMEVTIPEISGVLSDKALLVVIPLVAGGFADKLSNGAAHSPVYVTVWELVRALDGVTAEQQLVLFKGRVSRVVRNHHGKTDETLIEAKTLKSRLDVPLGLPSNHQCVWTLGGRGCGVTVPTSSGTVTAISGKTVTITGLLAQADRFWHRGYVDRNGLRIMIRNWVSGTSFELVREPPAEWIDTTVTVHAGCDKTIETCRARFNNEEYFGGFGFAIPAYSPNFEMP